MRIDHWADRVSWVSCPTAPQTNHPRYILERLFETRTAKRNPQDSSEHCFFLESRTVFRSTILLTQVLRCSAACVLLKLRSWSTGVQSGLLHLQMMRVASKEVPVASCANLWFFENKYVAVSVKADVCMAYVYHCVPGLGVKLGMQQQKQKQKQRET